VWALEMEERTRKRFQLSHCREERAAERESYCWFGRRSKTKKILRAANTDTARLVQAKCYRKCGCLSGGENLNSERRSLEARVGIEPTHKGFADLSLTTWVPRLRGRAMLKTLANHAERKGEGSIITGAGDGI
jgi:hypothetical protein